MYSTPIQILLENVLTIINFSDNKDKFINDFLDLCFRNALLILVEKLPQEEQKRIQEMFAVEPSPTEIEKMTHNIISSQDYSLALFEATRKLFKDYIQEITPTLTKDQEENLKIYLNTLASPFTNQVTKLENK